jgi:hypothetical protein
VGSKQGVVAKSDSELALLWDLIEEVATSPEVLRTRSLTGPSEPTTDASKRHAQCQHLPPVS